MIKNHRISGFIGSILPVHRQHCDTQKKRKFDFLRFQRTKNYWNRPSIRKVMVANVKSIFVKITIKPKFIFLYKRQIALNKSDFTFFPSRFKVVRLDVLINKDGFFAFHVVLNVWKGLEITRSKINLQQTSLIHAILQYNLAKIDLKL